MTFIQLIFYMFAAVAVFSGCMVVLSYNPVKSVLFLILTFFASAGIWMILHAEFLALILVLVYVGAVMTLFLFVVMMLSTHLEITRKGVVRYWPVGILLMACLINLLVLAIGPEHFGLAHIPFPGDKSENYNNLISLGSVLYTDFVLPFEISAVILLTAIIAAISLAHRKAMRSKTQNVAAQIAVRKQDRIRIIKVPSEKTKSNPSEE